MEQLHPSFQVYRMQNNRGKWKYYELVDESGEHTISYNGCYYKKLKVFWDLNTQTSYLPISKDNKIFIFPL